MDYHGGGFYLGSCLEEAPFCAKICRELQAVVIGVDYRMAPFDKFPAAIEDAEDVVSALLDPQHPGYHELRTAIADFLRGRWFDTLGIERERKHDKVPFPPVPEIQLDPSRLAFSGASSGGNIALNMAIDAPASHGYPNWPSRIPPNYSTQIPLLLLYPSLDLRQLPSERFRNERMPVVDPNKKGLDIDDHLAATYVSREMAGHPRASPGIVDTAHGLHKQAKILLILSGVDTLWEQSEIYAKKIEAEGRGPDVKTMRYEDRKHGWVTIPEIALSKEERQTRLEVLEECVRFTKVAWEGQDPVAMMHRDFGDVIVPPPKPRDDDTAIPQDAALRELIDMGFNGEVAKEALAENNGNAEEAVEWLLRQAHEESGHTDAEKEKHT
jgi:acetyl esterase/lipase